MHLKSYFAETVQMAVEQARRELGPEAALVTSRVSPAEATHLGHYEVVFASDLPEMSPVPPPAASTPTAAPPGGMEQLAAEMEMVRREFDVWRRAALSCMEQPRWMLGDSELEAAYFHLIEAEVDRDLALQLLSTARQAAGPGGADLRETLAGEIRRSLRVDTALGADSCPQKLVALVGPPGAGKTATLAKLAVRFGLAERRPMALISYDSLRLAASEELRWYASILGVSFQSVETTMALAQSIEEHRGKELILIDTPGFTARDLADGCEEGEYLARRDDIQKHLVLPVSMRSSDLARASAAFDLFRPSRLIFTRLDETEVYGPVLCESVRSGRPLSFFAAGQRVPDDLEPAGCDLIVERLLPAAPASARKALSAA